MAILFFEGFDRCTITKDLDQNFWSFEPQQPVEYEKYAFGGYSYDHSEINYGSDYYSYYTPNNAIQPSGTFKGNYISDTFGGGEAVLASGNYYPGFGQPLGFLALNNLDITNSNLLAPLTYLQLSGFPLAQSGQSFLSARILGIETKDTNYADSDLPGRFGNKHPLLAFCSGNTTGLLLNIVKVTGNHIGLVENQKMTIGLEVEQLNGISGTFDLNISEDLSQYEIKSVYSDQEGFQSGDLIGRILTIDSDGDQNNEQSYKYSPISRWCHFQFGIIKTGIIPYIQVKIDDVDLLSIPIDDSITDKDLWEDKINISGFDYDNVRFFNRTYNGSINFKETRLGSYGSIIYIGDQFISRYYMLGATTLIDDLIISDGSGTPSTFLGSNAKVVPFTPGINGNINNNGIIADGLTEWETNSNSYRTAFKNADGDDGKINTSTLDAITAVRYKNNNIRINYDPQSQWRQTLEDAVGGIKIYTQAKKQFLDSNYEIVIFSGLNDPNFIEKVEFIFNGDIEKDTAKDRSRNYTLSEIGTVTANTGIVKFNNDPSIQFSDSYLKINENFLIKSTASNQASLKSNDLFSFESFVYFTGSDPLTLFGTHPPSAYANPFYTNAANYQITCTTGHIDYTYYINDTVTDNLRLFFPENLNTGEWHHIALSSFAALDNADRYLYPLVCFANGVSGTSFSKYTYADVNNNLPTMTLNTFNQYEYSLDFDSVRGNYVNHIDVASTPVITNPVSSFGIITGSGLFSNPSTGTLSFTFNINNRSAELLKFDVEHSGYLVLNFSNQNTGGANVYHNLHIYRNDILQYISYGSLTGISSQDLQSTTQNINLCVSSGDQIKLTAQVASSDTSTANFDFYIHSGYIADNTVSNNFYYLPSGYIYSAFESHPLGLFANFGNFYMTGASYSSFSYNSSLRWPLFIGGNHLISDMRLTKGINSYTNTVRYQDNFIVPTEFLKSIDDSYIKLGETQSLSRTRYGKIQQFYQYNNPITNDVWTTGLINNSSGILLGVKKV